MNECRFKKSWIPTPLRMDHALPQVGEEEEAPPVSPGSPAAPLPGATLAAAAGSTLLSVASSARQTVANSALATAAGSTLSSVANSALVTAAGSALASARKSAVESGLASVAGSVLTSARSVAAASFAAALEPFPSPVGLAHRTSFILKFFLRTLLSEFLRSVLALIGYKWIRSTQEAHRTREFAERLGGSWITLVRLAALRGDLLGVDYCRELARTRDHSTPVPLAAVRAVVDADLRARNTSFDETFVEFSEQPLIVRSFGQTHLARLRKDDAEVTVRVRAPDAMQRAKTDWRYLRLMLFFMELFDIEPHMRWADLFFEVRKTTDDLLDFRTEVEELRRLAKILRKRKIYVPYVHEKLCTEQVLVLEHVSGVDVEDLMRESVHDPERCDAWMRENKIDPRRIWRRLFSAHNELLFEHNLFYTELAPSRICLLKKNRLAFVSFGSIGTLDADLQTRYRQLYRALLDNDYSKACDIYLMMGPALPHIDMTNMKQSTLRALRKWDARTHIKSHPYSEKSLGAALDQLAQCAQAQELPAFWNLARLQAAENMLNKSLEFFDHTKSGFTALKRYEREAQIRSIEQAATKNVRKRVDAAVDVAQLNMQLLENLQNDGDYLRRRLIGVQAKLGKISEVVGRLVKIVAKLAMVALLLQVVLHFTSGARLPGPLAEGGTVGRILSAVRPRSNAAWIALLAILFYLRRFLTNLIRQLFSKEVGPG